uniref:hypothetical protein n=1 Tax=Halostella sp. PRR32 TaxID=3098147 RepID=UPI002B1DFA3C
PRTGGYRKFSLEEKMNKKYPFPDDKVEFILEMLLKNNRITLLEVRKPGEVGLVHDPKYCKWHQMLGHGTKDCFVLKNKIE